MTKPLHYKIIVTKKRLHLVHGAIFTAILIGFSLSFIFFHNSDLSSIEYCANWEVLHEIGNRIIEVIYVILIVITVVNYAIITINLRSYNIITNPNSFNSKMARASLLAGFTFLTVSIPSAIATILDQFTVPISEKVYTILQISYLLYYVNNAINPFIYYATFKDFREGYKNLLRCRMFKKIKSQRMAQFPEIPVTVLSNF